MNHNLILKKDATSLNMLTCYICYIIHSYKFKETDRRWILWQCWVGLSIKGVGIRDVITLDKTCLSKVTPWLAATGRLVTKFAASAVSKDKNYMFQDCSLR